MLSSFVGRPSIDMGDFMDHQKKTTIDSLSLELQKLMQTAPGGKTDLVRSEFDGFEQLFHRFLLDSQSTAIKWEKIEKLRENTVLNYSGLVQPETPQEISAMLSKLVVVKLNGGLGTSMGCTGPKSLIQVRNDLTFLDMTISQIEELNLKYGVDVPLVLMNSFNTHDDTGKVLHKYRSRKVRIITFQQSRYPRIDRETLMPVAKNLSHSANDV